MQHVTNTVNFTLLFSFVLKRLFTHTHTHTARG